MPTYRELLMSRDSFLELRERIRQGILIAPQNSAGHALTAGIDLTTGDLVIHAQNARGDIVRTHRVIIKDETIDVPRET